MTLLLKCRYYYFISKTLVYYWLTIIKQKRFCCNSHLIFETLLFNDTKIVHSNINQAFVQYELLLFLGKCTTLFMNGYVTYARKLTGYSAGQLFNDHFCNPWLQF